MITLFTTPKPHTGVAALNQRNAIQSWMHLGDDVEILVLTDEDQRTVFESNFRVRVITEFERGEENLPKVDSLFEVAQVHATYDLMAYVNTDIILMSDFWMMLQIVAALDEPFMVVGQRWDVAMSYWDFDSPTWERSLHEYVYARGKLHAHSGKDYFVFRRPFGRPIPPFYIARCVFDNWLMGSSIDVGWKVIDATPFVFVVHGNHVIYDKYFRDDPLYRYNVSLGEGWEFQGFTTQTPWILTATGQIRRRT